MQATARNKNEKLNPKSPKPDGIGINLHAITHDNNNAIITNDLISLNVFNEFLKNDLWNGVL